MEKVLGSFLKLQKESEERFKQHEEERWKRETELEEKRRKEDREHDGDAGINAVTPTIIPRTDTRL